MTDQIHKLNQQERRAALALAGVYAMRMMGLFMLLPVIAIYASKLEGATPTWVGISVGIYGLTQAVLQIPFGLLSDRFGRKPVIYIGLVLFALGSVWAAVADSIQGLVLARALQGSGAVAAAIMALAADVSREDQRTKVMAIIGASIGASFIVSLALGPFLGAYVGVSGLFWLGVVFALGSMCVIKFAVPNPAVQSDERKVEWRALLNVVKNLTLMRLNVSILILHALMTAMFVYIPFVLLNQHGMNKNTHWHVYLPVMFASLMLAAPFIVKASRVAKVGGFVRLSVVGVGLTFSGIFFFAQQFWGLLACLLFFFLFFSVLESLFPAQISKKAEQSVRGAALGLYTSFQFFGAFLGGALMGKVQDLALSPSTVGVGALAVLALWFVCIASYE